MAFEQEHKRLIDGIRQHERRTSCTQLVGMPESAPGLSSGGVGFSTVAPPLEVTRLSQATGSGDCDGRRSSASSAGERPKSADATQRADMQAMLLARVAALNEQTELLSSSLTKTKGHLNCVPDIVRLLVSKGHIVAN